MRRICGNGTGEESRNFEYIIYSTHFMTFIKSFSIETDKQHPFPFNIPAVRFAKEITLDPKVTIFVGDNGCGKSTLLESMAYYLHIPLIGGHIASSASFEAAKLLKGYLRIEWKRQTAKGFFFRAEDFSDFINGVEREKNKIAGELSELKGNVRDSIIEELSMSDNMNYTLGKCARITCIVHVPLSNLFTVFCLREN